MHITRVHIEGFKRFAKFDLELNPTFNVIVGDNETGKSSVLEAIGLVLSGLYGGRLIQHAIDPYLFNEPTFKAYFQKRQNGEDAAPPKIEIEAYFYDDPNDPDLAKLKGSNNTRNEDCPGLVLTIEVDPDHVETLRDYASDNTNPEVLPVEFYRPKWRSFADNGVSLRNLPFRAMTIDTSLARVHWGPNKYLSEVVNDALTEEQRRQLSLAYRKLRYGFTKQPGVTAINEHLERQGNPATTKTLTVQMDMSSRSSWDSAITAHLDALPFDCAGKGEQCRVQMRLAIAGAEQSRVLLIEEPENHLSHSNLNAFMDDISKDCGDRQVIVATHSAFVLNKLGIDNLRLISHTGQTTSLTELTPGTKDYFTKLPGYDTLRLILSKRSILVEGPSDELIVQRAYMDKHDGTMPLANGIDVISVGTAFLRFLEIAKLLDLDVCVVTDNDGKVAALKKKYEDYPSDGSSKIKICYDDDERYPTLEPQMLKANSVEKLNDILGTECSGEADLLAWMGDKKNKTPCALKLFTTQKAWTTPDYIAKAIH